MPISPKTLENFIEGRTDKLELTSHSPSLTPADMKTIVDSIAKRVEKRHHNPIVLLLNENNIGDEGAKLIGQCQGARFAYVAMAENDLTDACLAELIQANIEALEISSNLITDAGAEILAKSKIQELSVRGTEITAEGVRMLLSNSRLKTIDAPNRQVIDKSKHVEEDHVEKKKIDSLAASSKFFKPPISPPEQKKKKSKKKKPIKLIKRIDETPKGNAEAGLPASASKGRQQRIGK